MKIITVRLAERSYPIVIGVRLEALGPYLKKRGFSPRVLVVTNTTVKKLYFSRLARSLARAGFAVSSVVLPDGEKYKRLDTVEIIYRQALTAQLDRRSAIIALGGGVIGDIAGFAAATYLRGVPIVQVPTTLLAMVDSSVGGKTGVDLAEGKNLVGAFYQPKAVWIDPKTLATLPEREVRNGLAEVIKYGVIADKGFFLSLEKLLSTGKKIPLREFERIIARCCAIKARVVREDEREEKGVREILNFGHTFGHAIETLGGYKEYSHGEAVAIGMNLAAKLAGQMGIFREQRRVEHIIRAAGLPVAPAKKFFFDAIAGVMQRDKKVREGKLRFVVPVRIGKVAVRPDIPLPMLREVFP